MDSPARYPWDEWLDGDEHVLHLGVDFFCAPRSMIVAIQRAARRRGGHCRPAECDDGSGTPAVWFQFRPGPYRSPDLSSQFTSFGRPDRACPHPKPMVVAEKHRADLEAIARGLASTLQDEVNSAIVQHVAATRRAHPDWFAW